MLIIDKVVEITGGKYHFNNKEIDGLLNMSMKDYAFKSFAGDTIRYIETPVVGKYGYKILALTKTKSGKNKDSWRIISTYK